MSKNLRDYGLPNMDPSGTPKATAVKDDSPCPNCGCQLMEVRVPVKSELLRGGRGVGIYLGCPACPWASPMTAVSDEVKNG